MIPLGGAAARAVLLLAATTGIAAALPRREDERAGPVGARPTVDGPPGDVVHLPPELREHRGAPPREVVFGFGDHVITDVTHVSYSASARPPNDHGATPAERAVTRGPTHNPGRLTRRERRRRAGR